jgi:hypothetical protein
VPLKRFRMPPSKEKVGQVFTFLAGGGYTYPIDVCVRLALLSVIGRDFLLYDRWLAVDTAVSMLIAEAENISRLSPMLGGGRLDESPRMREVLKKTGVCGLLYEQTGIDICMEGSPLDALVEITNRIRAGEIPLSEPLVSLLGKTVLIMAERIYPVIRRLVPAEGAERQTPMGEEGY